MANQRLHHDVAFAAAHHVLDTFVLRDEEKNEAFGRVYEVIRGALAAYDTQRCQAEKRLKPLEGT